MAAIVNEISIRKKLVSAATAKKQIPFYRNAAITRFNNAKEGILAEYDSHPVTQELLQDPSEPGSELVNKGNLISFIGLEDGSLEVSKIREYIRSNIKMGQNPTISYDKNRINLNFPITLPSKTELDEITSDVEWTSRSLISLIEKGIGNAAHYIFRSLGLPGSRSGFGLQIRSETKSGGTFRPKLWITEIFNSFRDKFR